MFRLYFQPKRRAWKQKEAGIAIGSSGIEERRKIVKNSEELSELDAYSTSRHEHSRSNKSPCCTQILNEGLGESVTGLDESALTFVPHVPKPCEI